MINTLSPNIYQAMQLNSSIYKQIAQLFMYQKKLKQTKRYVNEKSFTGCARKEYFKWRLF